MLRAALTYYRRAFPPVERNVNRTRHPQRCLLVYITKPFRNTTELFMHQNRWQVRELARLIGEHGYNVDVIDWYHRRVQLRGTYDLIVDSQVGRNDAYEKHVGPSTKRVALLTTANPRVSNEAEAERLRQLRRRRGVTLKARWYIPPYSREALTSCAALWLMGNTHTLTSYAGLDTPPVSLLPNTGYPFLYTVGGTQRSPRSFLFLGSRGQVHKGLDLVLEAFARLPHLRLYVCGHFGREKDFCRAYRRELFHTSNIVPVGFLDLRSVRFKRLAEECTFTVLPSCAEGMSGSVLTAMSAGLIPLVSEACGFDRPDVHHFPECTVEAITDTVSCFSAMPIESLRTLSRQAISIVQAKYAPEHYTKAVRGALDSLGGAAASPRDRGDECHGAPAAATS